MSVASLRGRDLRRGRARDGGAGAAVGRSNSLQALLPVPRPSAVVSDRQDPQRLGGLRVDHMVGKAPDRDAPHGQVAGYSWYRGAGSREVDDALDSGINLIEELDSEACLLVIVPATSLTVFGVGLVLEADGRVHGLRRAASARARTSAQGTPCPSPVITRRARLSISAAHAASTSAGFSAASPSRLARSSAATLARSSTGRVNASRRRPCALEVIQAFYAPLGRPTSRPAAPAWTSIRQGVARPAAPRRARPRPAPKGRPPGTRTGSTAALDDARGDRPCPGPAGYLVSP